MRYIFTTEDSEGVIGMQIAKWEKEKKIILIEKGEPVVEIQAHLERVSKALEVLKKAGYNSQVMKSWIHDNTALNKKEIDSILSSQEEFFRQTGILKREK